MKMDLGAVMVIINFNNLIACSPDEKDMQRVRCNPVGGATLACWDGYVNNVAPFDCLGSCGLTKYGSATFNTRH